MSSINSFGYHTNSSQEINRNSIAQFQAMARACKMAFICNSVALVVLGVTAACIPSPLFIPALAIVVTSLAVIGACYCGIKSYNYHQICETAGIVFRNSNELSEFNPGPSPGLCESIATENCADTEVWRNEMIDSAQHNIIISGNYCGGKSFAQLLDRLEKNIKLKEELKVVLISSPQFVQTGNRKKIQHLLDTYPNRFSYVESPNIWFISNGIKKSTNHTKCTVIDYGKYFMLGGSGIEDKFSGVGLDSITKEEYLKKRPMNLTIPKNTSTNFKNTETQQEDKDEDEGEIGNRILVALIPGNFRDMDFVFRSSDKNSITGTEIYKQMLLLGYRWEKYNAYLNSTKNAQTSVAYELGVFTNTPSKINEEDGALDRLIKTPIPTFANIKTRLMHFNLSIKRCREVSCQIFSSGPEQSTSGFALELENKIKNASKRIVVNHMYFHPSTPIMNALIEAAKRGVKIEIISTGVYDQCPKSHLFFGPRNKYNYAYLLDSLSTEEKNNVQVFEFQQKKKGFHKKVIIVDDTVIAGSSNLGYKSLVTTSDHEINFSATSATLATQTYEICKVDIAYSARLEGPIKLNLKEYCGAIFHRMLAPLIG